MIPSLYLALPNVYGELFASATVGVALALTGMEMLGIDDQSAGRDFVWIITET